MICPNCGEETAGDFCQWCGYPIMKGNLVRSQRAKKEAELAAKEKAKREAMKAKEKAKGKAEGEAKRAEEKAKKEAELAAKEKAKREAKEAKEKAKRKVGGEARKAKERAKRKAEGEAETVVVNKLYKGVVELTVVPPVGLGRLENLEKDLRRVENLRLVLVGGSVDMGNRIVVSAEEPIPLLRVLRELPLVEQVVSEGGEIQITLKAE